MAKINLMTEPPVDLLKLQLKQLEKQLTIEREANERMLNRLQYLEARRDPTIPILLKIKDVCQLTGIKRSTIYKKIQDNEFPKPIKITGRLSSWYEKDIKEWLQNLKTPWGF